MELNIPAIIVLYNPNIKDFISTLDNTLLLVDKVYIIDNSDEVIGFDVESYSDKITYYSCNGNLGIAHALNIGCKLAIDDGYLWGLTLDQDSILPNNMIDDFKAFISNNTNLNIGILTSQINVYSGEHRKAENTIDIIDSCFTSGSLTNLKAFERVGGFKEEMFIDYVDFEFCLNLKKNGYQIYRLNSVVMDHKLGNTNEFRFLNYHLFYVTHHNYIRHYYMSRNMNYVYKVYSPLFPSCFRFFWFNYIKSLFKILLFESDKLRKIKSRIKGFVDYKNNKWGKYKI